jgi:hypothetical protein
VGLLSTDRQVTCLHSGLLAAPHKRDRGGAVELKALTMRSRRKHSLQIESWHSRPALTPSILIECRSTTVNDFNERFSS